MTFGLPNAPATFQDALERIFIDLLDSELCIYMDYFLIYSESLEVNIQGVLEVLQRVKENNIAITPDKSVWNAFIVEFDRYFIYSKGIQMIQDMIKTILELQKHEYVHDVHVFLACLTTNWQLFEAFARTTKSITNFFRNGILCNWSHECAEAFQDLKQHVTKTPLFKHFKPIC
jgi:hypothetical protein